MTNLAIRWSGLLLIVGAALIVAANILSSTPETSQQLPPLVNPLLFISSILFLLSLPAMYARQANAAGFTARTGWDSHRYRYALAQDNANPGAGADFFSLTVNYIDTPELDQFDLFGSPATFAGTLETGNVTVK